jgi:hypothetical protein
MNRGINIKSYCRIKPPQEFVKKISDREVITVHPGPSKIFYFDHVFEDDQNEVFKVFFPQIE